MANPDDYGIYSRKYPSISKSIVGVRHTKGVERLGSKVSYFEWPSKFNVKIAPCKLLMWNNDNTRINRP